jgi:hypothetical protein
MNWLDWVLSFAILAWLVILAVGALVDIGQNPVWAWIPLVVAAIYRLISGRAELLVVAAAIVLLVSERRHLKQKILEWIILAAGILVIGYLMFTTDLSTGYAIIGIILFWAGWELKMITGVEAMVLITCQLVWTGIEFLEAYLVAGLVWSIIVRIREGKWLKGHALPSRAVVASGAALYLLWRLMSVFNII